MSAAGLETWVVAWGYAAIFVVVLLLTGLAWQAWQRAKGSGGDERTMSWGPGRTRQIVSIR